jgi:hypothetical protein
MLILIIRCTPVRTRTTLESSRLQRTRLQGELGGCLGLWRPHLAVTAARALCKRTPRLFNCTFLFDTTRTSRHGLPEPIRCLPDISRNRIAVYSLCEPRPTADPRGKGLWTAQAEKASERRVLELLKGRSSLQGAATAYGDKPDSRGQTACFF